MIEVEMSKDIRDCEPKFLGPLTKRQVLFVGVSLCYGIPAFIALKAIPDTFVRIIVTIILMAPCVACGWCDMYGMHLEQFALHVLKNCILKPGRRLYKNENTYEEISHLFETVPEKTKKVKRSKKDGRIL